MPFRKLVGPFLMLLFIGAGTLQQTISRPRMANVRGVDIVSLTGSGFCFGVAFGFLIMMLRWRQLQVDPVDQPAE